MIESIKAENWSSTHQSGGARPPDLSVGKNLINWQMSNNWNLIFPTKYCLQGLFSASNLKSEFDSKDTSQTEFIARVYIMCVCAIVCFHVFIFLLKGEAAFSTFHQLDPTSPTPVFDAKSFQETLILWGSLVEQKPALLGWGEPRWRHQGCPSTSSRSTRRPTSPPPRSMSGLHSPAELFKILCLGQRHLEQC